MALSMSLTRSMARRFTMVFINSGSSCVGTFYALFWSKGGQTLGMRAWRLKIQHPKRPKPGMITAYARIVWSLLGIGNLWILINGNKLCPAR